MTELQKSLLKSEMGVQRLCNPCMVRGRHPLFVRSFVILGVEMKRIAEVILGLLLYLPCNKITSRLVDKLIVYIEGGQNGSS